MQSLVFCNEYCNTFGAQNSRQIKTFKKHVCSSKAQRQESPTVDQDALVRRFSRIQNEAQALQARTAVWAERHEKIRQVLEQVTKEQNQLAAAETMYQSTDDAVREWVCLAEHGCSFTPATAAPAQTVQAAIQAAPAHTAVSMLAETIGAEATRLVVHTRALRLRRLEMSWCMSHQDPQVVQQLRAALQKPGLLPAGVEEQAFSAVLQQLFDIRKCNKLLTAKIVKHAATHIYKNKRRAYILRAMQSTGDHCEQLETQRDQAGQPPEAQQHSTASQAECAAAAALAGLTPGQKAELTAQEWQLQSALEAFHEIRDIKAEELDLHSRSSNEEIAMVVAFMRKMSAQLHESHNMLCNLETELKAEHDRLCKVMLNCSDATKGISR